MLFDEKGLLDPVKTVRGTPMFDSIKVYKIMYRDISVDNFFNKRVKKMNNDLNKANAKVDSYVENITKNMDRLVNKEDDFLKVTKRVSSNIRKNSENMSTGIGRIKDAANFEELERYTNILERFVVALDTLANIEKQGKLDKIIASIK